MKLITVVVGLLCLSTTVLRAQIRPDTTKRDTTKIVIPIPAPAVPPAPVVGAPRSGQPQVGPPKPGSPEDSAAMKRVRERLDSIAKFKTGDTVRAPLARFERPQIYDLTDGLRFSRREILSSGAINLADLLDQVPGVTSFRTGWLAGIHAASYGGDFSRVRIFLDGIEMDAVEARNGGTLDLDDVPLWTLDELVIERTASEVRVWLRSWSYNKTIPYTRVDIFTGDRNTNGFRGLFARRFDNGFILQVGAQQAATQSGQVSAFTTTGTTRTRGDGSQQLLNTRVGWAKGRLSIDFYGTLSARDRDAQTARKDFVSLRSFKGARRDGALRVGFGDTSTGFWWQAVLSAVATTLNGVRDTTAVPVGKLPGDTTTVKLASADSIRARSQQMIAVGFRAKNWQYSFIDRLRSIGGHAFHAPAVRASIGSSQLGVGFYAEHRGVDSTTLVDVSARAEPLKWLVLTAAQSLRSPSSATERPSASFTRVEAGVRLGSLLLGGGAIHEGATTYLSPVLLGASPAGLNAAASTGLIGSVHGRLFKDVRLDVQGVHWSGSQFGRPTTSLRTELAVISDWKSHFPKGQFSFNARVLYEMRSAVPFYYGLKKDGTTADVRLTQPSNVLSALLEIRIQRATLFYKYRNLTGGDYEMIPGLTMPNQVQMYGVRWEFFN